MRKVVATADAPKPVFSYSQGIASGDFLFVSGQVPVDPVTKAVPASFDDQVRRALANVAAIAEAAGTGLANAVRVGVYLADLANFEAMDKVYREHFQEPLPSRTTLGVSLPGFAIEIDAVIALGNA